MIINAPRWRHGRTASRISAAVIAAAVATMLPLAVAGGPAGAAVRALPGQALLSQAAPRPAGRVWTSWADDPAAGQVVLFGGDQGYRTSGPDNVLGSTWTWNGSAWTKQQPAANAGRRAYGSLTYDQALQRLVMFGGSNRTKDLTTLWEWNGTTWQQT